MAKSALIIGATGLLGRGVASELSALGWELVLLSRGKITLPAELASQTHIIVDRNATVALGAALDGRHFDVVVDCAAYRKEDALGAVKLWGGKTGHYFFISTDFVYAPDPAATFPLKEDAVKLGSLPYAKGKLEAEKCLLDASREQHFPVTILRPPHILGAGKPVGCDPVAGGRDATLPDRLRAGETIPLLADGQFLIQPLWSREIGRAIAALAGKTETFGGLFNITGPECVTTRQYYQMIADLLGVPLKTASEGVEEFCAASPEKGHMARHRIYDISALRQVGYIPSLSLKSALAETLSIKTSV